MTKSRILISWLVIIFECCAYLYAEDFKPIVLEPSYNHAKYAPVSNENDIVRRFRAYTTCFDGDDDDNGNGVSDKLAIPHWISYEIKKYQGELGAAPRRPSSWISDEDLYAQGLAPKDESYHFSREWREAHLESSQLGYDRGHLCMKQHAWRLGANADWNTHTVLNACPQKADLNQGIWQDLEKKTAEWADKYGSIWIITGPIVYDHKPSEWLGQPGEVPVAIPHAFYKIVIKETDGKLLILSFIYPQNGIDYKHRSGNDHGPYLTSIDIIEALTDLDFFPSLCSEMQDRLESVTPIELWD